MNSNSNNGTGDKVYGATTAKKHWSTPELTLYGQMTASTRSTSTNFSDRNAKTGFAPVDVRAVLAALSTLPIETWNYKSDDPSVRHIGPMAQDFAALFKVGDHDKHIHVVDSAGVALAAIQGLNSLVEEQDATICRLRSQLAVIEADLAALRASTGTDRTAPAGASH